MKTILPQATCWTAYAGLTWFVISFGCFSPTVTSTDATVTSTDSAAPESCEDNLFADDFEIDFGGWTTINATGTLISPGHLSARAVRLCRLVEGDDFGIGHTGLGPYFPGASYRATAYVRAEENPNVEVIVNLQVRDEAEQAISGPASKAAVGGDWGAITVTNSETPEEGDSLALYINSDSDGDACFEVDRVCVQVLGGP